jgi:threonine/homoserine/homoserine lactone efflux protein
MSAFLFLVQAVLISLSGALSPGPMTAVAIGKGHQSPHAGAFIALGHGIVEFPLMISIFFGVAVFLTASAVKLVIAFLGGIMLIYMGYAMLKNMRNAELSGAMYQASPVVAGVLLAVGNPYFIIWWATVGATLIVSAAEYGFVVFIAFMVCHWLCDFVWYYLLSFLAYKGGRSFGRRFQLITSSICGIFLLIFGSKFMYDGIIGLIRV